MTQGTHIIERAFQLAPECTDVNDIVARLKREGYVSVDAHLGGGAIRSDLKKLLRS